MFYIYYIKNQKIGCTKNIKKRVEIQQGEYNYKILFKTDNILLASNKEIELQKKFFFKTDKTKYINLINQKQKKMYHTTEKTITFKNSNIQNINLLIPDVLEINKTLYPITEEIKNWIIKNNFKSQINEERFIYIKSFLIKFNEINTRINFDNSIDLFNNIRNWAKNKGIYDKGDPKTQCLKLVEESGELAKAILNNDKEEIIDALGDCVVVLVNLSELCGYKLEDCIESAYNVIKNRKGKMENGTFIKNNEI